MSIWGEGVKILKEMTLHPISAVFFATVGTLAAATAHNEHVNGAARKEFCETWAADIAEGLKHNPESMIARVRANGAEVTLTVPTQKIFGMEIRMPFENAVAGKTPTHVVNITDVNKGPITAFANVVTFQGRILKPCTYESGIHLSAD